MENPSPAPSVVEPEVGFADSDDPTPQAPEDASRAVDEHTPLEEPCALAREVREWDFKDTLLCILVVLATFYTIYFTRTVLFPITLAVILNLVFKPIVLYLERVHIPAFLGAALILITFAVLVGVGVWLVWNPATERIAEIQSPGYLERLSDKLEPIQRPLEELEKATKKVEEITSRGGEAPPTPVQVQQPRLGDMLNSTSGFLGSTVIMFVLLYFLLASGDRFLEKLVELMPTFHDKRRMVQFTREVQHRMSDYLFTISAINVLLGAAIGVGMWWIELPNPVLWGVVATLLNFIPFAGPTIGAILVFIEGLVSFNSLGQALLAPLIYVGINAIEANFITPTMLGKSISLNPVMIVIAIVFWGWLWGIGGVLLAVPLLVVLKIFFDHSERLAPFGTFLER